MIYLRYLIFFGLLYSCSSPEEMMEDPSTNPETQMVRDTIITITSMSMYHKCENQFELSGNLITALLSGDGFSSSFTVDEVGFVLAPSETATNPSASNILIEAERDVMQGTIFQAFYHDVLPNVKYSVWGYARVGQKYFYSIIRNVVPLNLYSVSDLDNITIERLKDFPGTARGEAVSFTANGMGYMCCGYDGTSYLNDFWKYNPNTDTWIQLNDFPGDPSAFHTAFVIDEYAYVFFGGTGSAAEENTNEIFKYHVKNDEWTPITSTLTSLGFAGVSMVENTKAFIYNLTNLQENRIIEFDSKSENLEIRGVQNFNLELNSSRNMSIRVDSINYFLSTSLSNTEVYLFNPAEYSLSLINESFWGADDGLVFEVDGQIFYVTGRGLEDNIGRFNVLNGVSHLYCNNDEGLRRSEAIGFVFDNEIIISNGVTYSEDPQIHDNPLNSTYKITIQ